MSPATSGRWKLQIRPELADGRRVSARVGQIFCDSYDDETQERDDGIGIKGFCRRTLLDCLTFTVFFLISAK